MMRLVILVGLIGLLALAPALAYAGTVYYFIVFPGTGAGWGPVRFDFLSAGDCASAHTFAIARYGAAAVWSKGLAGCVTEVQP